MTSPAGIEYVCPHCRQTNLLPENAVLDLVFCSRCNEILFELDDSRREVRVTKGFQESFRVLKSELDGLRRFFLDENRKRRELARNTSDQRTDSTEGAGAIPAEVIERIETALSRFQNENAVSDENTRESALSLITVVTDYAREAGELAKTAASGPDEPATQEAFLSMKEKLKDVNAFARMMSNYLGVPQE